jgi:predicted nucleic acid-binding protein
MRLYFDANALIRAAESDDEVAGVLRALLASEASAVVTSELTFAEVLVGPMKRRRADSGDLSAVKFIAGYEALFGDATAVAAVPVTVDILRAAATLRAERTALKLPDAIHLATAIRSGCAALVSDDDRLGAAASDHLSICSFAPAELNALLTQTTSAP